MGRHKGRVVCWFYPWRDLTERERELVERAMHRAATDLLHRWDRLDDAFAKERERVAAASEAGDTP